MLASALPDAQAHLDRDWEAQTALALEQLRRCNTETLPALARAVLPARYIYARQTVQVSCHASVRHDTQVSVGASLRFTPLSVEAYLRNERALERAWHIEATVEQVWLRDGQD